MQALYTQLEQNSPVSVTIIGIAVMLLSGFLMTRVTKRLKLPNVTAYIVAGILIGPFVFDLVPKRVMSGSSFLPDIALAFIAFSTGQFFKLSTLKKNGGKVVLITVTESLTASLFVFIVTYWILGLDLPFSIVLAALAAATAPASTLMTIRQTGAKGDFVETLLQVVALDDIVGLLMYAVAISVAVSARSGESFNLVNILLPLGENLAAMILGCLFGVLLKIAIPARRSTDNRLIIAIAMLLSFCGICAAIDVSPLLGCMTMATVYINMTKDDNLFMQLNYFSPPILLLFFVRSGANFDIGSLMSNTGSIGAVPLLVIGVIYFAVRILGKYLGAFAGCAAVKKDRKVRDFLGLALIPQAGVAIGLAALGARTLGGEEGAALETIILASSVLYELIGPACAKLSLYLSGSYSDKLEALTNVAPVDESGRKLSPVEELIARIQKIQEELPKRELNAEEQAFDEAAREHFEAQQQNRGRNQHFRRFF